MSINMASNRTFFMNINETLHDQRKPIKGVSLNYSYSNNFNFIFNLSQINHPQITK